MPSGGALATVFCSGITTNPGVFVPSSSTPLPFELGGVRVEVNGVLAPLLAVVIPPKSQTGAYAQINFQVPLERNSALDSDISEISQENVVVFVSSSDGHASSTILAAVRGGGGFFSDANGYAIAQHASDYSLVTTQNPAHAGETLIVYADDFFEVWPPPPIGLPAPSQPLLSYNHGLNRPDLLFFGQDLYLQSYPSINPIGGASIPKPPALQILFEGLAPGMVGVEQINFVVPGSQAAGDWPLFFNYVPCTNGAVQNCNGNPGIGVSSPYALIPVR